MEEGGKLALIGLDFDHTLVEGDKAIEGAREAVNLLREKGHKVIIFSANRLEWIKKTLDNLDIRYDKIYANKPNLDLFVDDKAHRFEGNWSREVNEILSYVDGLDNRKW